MNDRVSSFHGELTTENNSDEGICWDGSVFVEEHADGVVFFGVREVKDFVDPL